MALRHFGFILSGPGLDPTLHCATMQSASFKMTAVGVSRLDDGVAVARRLANDGAQLIELCGGFDAATTARIVAAVGPKVPVGRVAYGPEALAGMCALSATP